MRKQYLSSPNNHNDLVSAFCLGFLLSTLNNENQLDSAINDLFGCLTGRESSALINQLDNYSSDTFPPLLKQLIDTQLRPKIAQFIRERRAVHNETNPFFQEDGVALSAASQAVEIGNPLFDEIIIYALEQITQVRIQLDNTNACIKQETTNNLQTVVYLAWVDTRYYYLVDSQSLPEVLRNNLFPFSKLPQAMSEENIRLMLKRAKLKELVIDTLTNTTKHLEAISGSAPGRRPELDEYSTRPTDASNLLRTDSIRESHVARNNLNRVQLTTPYDLCLNSSSDGTIYKNRLYIDMEPTGFTYTLRTSEGVIIPKNENRFITYVELELTPTESVTLDNLKGCLPNILKITSSRGHTLVTAANMYVPSTLIKEGLQSIAAGATVGAFSVTAIVAVGELEFGKGIGIALIPSVGLATGGALMGLTLIAALYGKGFGIWYERALDEASILLNKGKFDGAADLLDAEFNRWSINKAARWFFLSQQHYALAHFLRGVCWEVDENYILSYEHYEKAAEHAAHASKTLTEYMSKLQLLKFLRDESIELPIKISDRHLIKHCVIGKVESDPTQGFFKSTGSNLTDQDAVILFANTLFYAECKTQTVKKIVITKDNKADSDRLKSTISTQMNDVSKHQMKLIITITGHTTRAHEIQTILQKLSLDHPDGFSDAYWGLHDTMTKTALRFITLQALNEKDIAIANAFLVSDGFFALTYFAGGLGLFMELFGAFFQSNILTFFHLTNPGAINNRTLSKLEKELNMVGVERNDEHLLTLASLKLFQCATLLHHFKLEFASLIRDRVEIQNCIELIEVFMIKFHSLFTDKQKLIIDKCSDINDLIEMDPEHAGEIYKEINQMIIFLVKLNQDFDVNFETSDQWLKAIFNSPCAIAGLRTKTGNTMLHAVAECPAGESIQRIQDAAIKLKGLRHIGNHKNITPFNTLLANDDPYELLTTLLSGVELGHCGLMSVSTGAKIPNVLDNRPFEAAYVQLLHSKNKGVYFVSQQQYTWIELSSEKYETFVNKMKPSSLSCLLDENDLELIKSIVGHSYVDSMWRSHINQDKQSLNTSIASEKEQRCIAEQNATMKERRRLAIEFYEAPHKNEETNIDELSEWATNQTLPHVADSYHTRFFDPAEPKYRNNRTGLIMNIVEKLIYHPNQY